MSLVLANLRPSSIIRLTPDDFVLDNPQNLLTANGQYCSATVYFRDGLNDWSDSCLMKFSIPSSLNDAVIDGFKYRFIGNKIADPLNIRTGSYEVALFRDANQRIGSFERYDPSTSIWPDRSVPTDFSNEQLALDRRFTHSGPDYITLFSGGNNDFSGGNYGGSFTPPGRTDFSPFYYSSNPANYGSSNRRHIGTFCNTFSTFTGISFRFAAYPTSTVPYTIYTDSFELDIYYTPARKGLFSIPLTANSVSAVSASIVGVPVVSGVEVGWTSPSNALLVNTTIATSGVGDCSAMLTAPPGSSPNDTMGTTEFLKYHFADGQIGSIINQRNKEIRVLWRGRVECLDSAELNGTLVFGGYVSVDQVIIKNATSGEVLYRLSDHDNYSCRDFKIGSFNWIPPSSSATLAERYRSGERDRAIALDITSLNEAQITAMNNDGFDIYIRWKLSNTINKYDVGEVPVGDETLTYCAVAVNGAVFSWGYNDAPPPQEGASQIRRKWWHANLEILNRSTNAILDEFHTGISSAPASNNSSITYAYADNSVVCDVPVSIPVPAFDETQSGGYFVFRPTKANLSSSLININTYQDVINLNNRRTFRFYKTAAYDPFDDSCSAIAPTRLDPGAYTPIITESLNSNVFQYPILPVYTQIGCCLFDLAAPSPGLSTPDSSESPPTRLWYLLDSPSLGASRYSLVSYDFGLATSQLANKGTIDTSIAPGIEIFDITWVPTDNSMLAITTDGIRRVFPGSGSSTPAILGDIVEFIDNVDYVTSFGGVFPLSSNDGIRKSIEYNWYTGKVMMFCSRKKVGASAQAFYFQLDYNSNNLTVSLTQDANAAAPNGITINSIGGFAFIQSGPDSLCIIDNSLYSVRIEADTNFGVPTLVGTQGGLAGMFTINFAQDPLGGTGSNILYAASPSGQQFIVDQSTGNPVLVSGPQLTTGSPIGCTTSLNGEDSRISPFPFLAGDAPWYFLVQISSSMAGPKLDRIKAAFASMLRTYVRYGDKITIGWYNNTTGQFTKELRTVSDATEVINYVNTNLIASSTTANLYASLSNIPQNFTNLKNVVILSDGACSDCGSTTAEWQQNFNVSVDSILAQNSQAKITVVGVNSTNNEKLLYIAARAALQGRGSYTSWNQ